ncbi:hypothetical protein [Piscibacillus halophilus]|uniref:hypothetical protein n=1 Tax=Piscibacillus halophilus TaxID=571933 RepID=UPI00158D0078|nr:hypothetical protein [Piscibacillus halophilus]
MEYYVKISERLIELLITVVKSYGAKKKRAYKIYKHAHRIKKHAYRNEKHAHRFKKYTHRIQKHVYSTCKQVILDLFSWQRWWING